MPDWTPEREADIRKRCEVGWKCGRCRNQRVISVRHGQIYLTDDDEEIAAAYHDERCPACGNDLPDALAEIERLREEISRLRMKNAALESVLNAAGRSADASGGAH